MSARGSIHRGTCFQFQVCYVNCMFLDPSLLLSRNLCAGMLRFDTTSVTVCLNMTVNMFVYAPCNGNRVLLLLISLANVLASIPGQVRAAMLFVCMLSFVCYAFSWLNPLLARRAQCVHRGSRFCLCTFGRAATKSYPTPRPNQRFAEVTDLWTNKTYLLLFLFLPSLGLFPGLPKNGGLEVR